VPKAKPIYQCANGHLICSHCKPSLTIQICPTCEIEYKDQPIRSIIAEKIWEIGAILPCRYEGCNFKATKAKIKDHKIECFYKTMKCMKCKKDVPMIEISDHIKKMHLGAKSGDDDEEFDPLEENKEILELVPEPVKKKEKPKKNCERREKGCKFEAHEQEELDNHGLTCLYRNVECYKCIGKDDPGKHLMNITYRHGYTNQSGKGFYCDPNYNSFKCNGSTGEVQPVTNHNYFCEINQDDKLFHVFVDNTIDKEVYVQFSGSRKEAPGYIAKFKYVTHIEHEELYQVVPYDLSLAKFQKTKHKSRFPDSCISYLKDTTIAVTIQKL
jgi:hypothetical protein